MCWKEEGCWTGNASKSSGWWITYVVSLGIVVFVIVIVLFKVIPLCLNSGSAAAVQGVTDDVLKLAKVFMRRRRYRASRFM